LGCVNGIEGCGGAAGDVPVGADATKVTSVVQHHQDELQSVLLVDDITIEKAAEEKQGKNASPEHYTSLQMRQRHRGRGMPFEP
jgi:hypothetical protein